MAIGAKSRLAGNGNQRATVFIAYQKYSPSYLRSGQGHNYYRGGGFIRAGKPGKRPTVGSICAEW